MVNTDRFSANFRAERAMSMEQPHYVKCHYGCDHHACATVLGKVYALDIPKSHISAMIAGAMCMLDANSLRSLQECLMDCIAERLRIRVGQPPSGHCRDHQAALYDCFLGPAVEKYGPNRLKKLRQRCILTYFFNGDLEADDIEFWTTDLHPNREAILQAFHRHVVPALLPGKAPIFPRGRWTNSECSMEYFGLIDGHHRLLGPLVAKWLQKHGYSVSLNQPSNLEEEPDAGWASFLREEPVIADEATFQPVDSEHAAGEAQDSGNLPGHAATLPVDDEADKKEKWQEERRQWRAKFAAWSSTGPAPFLFLMRVAVGPVVALTYALLRLVGDAWEREQEQKAVNGGKRSYPVLEAARGTLLSQFWEGLRKAFHTEQIGLPMRAWTRRHQCLLFRMLSCAGCAMALHMQARWQAFPIKLFPASFRRCLWLSPYWL